MKKVEIAAYLWNMSKTEKHIYIYMYSSDSVP